MKLEVLKTVCEPIVERLNQFDFASGTSPSVAFLRRLRATVILKNRAADIDPATVLYATPELWIVFFHGVLGRRRNWLSIARQLVRARPDYGALLVDLRLHGDAPPRYAPHTIDTAAQDLSDLEDELARGGAADGNAGTLAGVLGHSLGGKIALSWSARPTSTLARAWVIDSMPGPTVDTATRASVTNVLDMLETLPKTFASRDAFLAAVESAGQPRAIAEWLGMNLVRSDVVFRFPLDLTQVRALVQSHFETDLWSAVEAPRAGLQIDLIRGGRSPAFSEGDLARARRATANPNVTLRTIPEAGHWVHVDAPAELLEMLLGDLTA